jgi:hypothetical protein
VKSEKSISLLLDKYLSVHNASLELIHSRFLKKIILSNVKSVLIIQNHAKETKWSFQMDIGGKITYLKQ